MIRKVTRVLILVGVIFVAMRILVAVKGSKAPEGLGAKDGELVDCPESPNCVCSDCEGQHGMTPLTFDRDAASAIAALKRELQRRKISILKEETNYLHAVASTTWMGFKDDLEFLIDSKEKVIHFRSASRLGELDFGKNRERLNEMFAELRKDGIRPRVGR